MFALRGRQDNFRILFPKDFIHPEIEEKYTKILQSKHSYITTPIDFINECVQSIQVLGFNEATVEQMQPGKGTYTFRNRPEENKFMHPASAVSYRQGRNPIDLVDKQLNVTFRHTLGYLSYFLLYENFFYQYARDTHDGDMIPDIYIEILDNKGNIYSRLQLVAPIIDSMDMLDLNYTQPTAQSQTFQVTFKFRNIGFDFIAEDPHKDDPIYVLN